MLANDEGFFCLACNQIGMEGLLKVPHLLVAAKPDGSNVHAIARNSASCRGRDQYTRNFTYETQRGEARSHFRNQARGAR
jgi:hypothetical protein